MDSLFVKRNTAVASNYAGPLTSIIINESGSDWYWAVFAIMAATTVGFSIWTFMKPREERIFHFITTGIVAVASIAYFTMASDLGSVPIITEFSNYSSLPTRQVFYARYIDWVITTPLLLTDLLLTAGLPWSTIVFTIAVDEVMVVTGLFGAITPSSYKWGYFTFGMVAYFYVAWVLIFEARTNAYRIGSDIHRLYIGIAVWTAFLWTLYPIAWGLSEGGNVTSSDGEAVFYGVLDILAKPVFGVWLLWGHRGVSLDRLGLVEARFGSAGGNKPGREKEYSPATDTSRVNNTYVPAATYTGADVAPPTTSVNTSHTAAHSTTVPAGQTVAV